MPYRTRLILGAIFSMLSAGSMTGGLSQFRDALKQAFEADSSFFSLLLIGVVMATLVLLMGVGKFLSTYYLQWVGQRVVVDLRIGLFAHLQDLSLITHNSTRTGEMISRVVSDTQMVQRAVSTVLTDLVRAPIVLITVLSWLLYTDWLLTLGSLVVFPFCVAPVLFFGKRVRRASRQGQERMADLSSVMQEALSGVDVVKAFCGEEREHLRFASHCRGFFSRTMRIVRAKALNEPIITLVAAIGAAATLGYAKKTGMQWQELITFIGGLFLIYDPVKRLSKIHLVLQQSAAAADRIFELLDMPQNVQEKEDAVEFSEALESVHFDNVAFAYDEERPVFTDLNVLVEAGSSVALVGGSGAGKTTMVNLLLRFFDPDSGTIRLNSTDIKELTFSSLRRSIGYVTQETFLFNDTVAANISYGKPDATRDEVIEAARRAHADSFINEMPDGYDTVIGERGTRLSGGQRQRLSIARAIIGNPPILLLDEATSALDTESERLVQPAIEELMGECTVIVIAHRLSTVIKCNKILVLGKGGVLEEGTHSELFAREGAYRHLYDLQFNVSGHGTT